MLPLTLLLSRSDVHQIVHRKMKMYKILTNARLNIYWCVRVCGATRNWNKFFIHFDKLFVNMYAFTLRFSRSFILFFFQVLFTPLLLTPLCSFSPEADKNEIRKIKWETHNCCIILPWPSIDCVKLKPIRWNKRYSMCVYANAQCVIGSCFCCCCCCCCFPIVTNKMQLSNIYLFIYFKETLFVPQEFHIWQWIKRKMRKYKIEI